MRTLATHWGPQKRDKRRAKNMEIVHYIEEKPPGDGSEPTAEMI